VSLFAGLDVGNARIGIAVSDEEKRIAFPLDIIVRDKDSYGFRRIAKLLENRDIELFVVGLPKRSDGRVGDEEKKIYAYVEGLKEYFHKKVVTWDERYTTIIAQKALQEGVRRGDKRKRSIDKLAAQIILQSYLDYINNV
jgi:putative Holliday junction resolvase